MVKGLTYLWKGKIGGFKSYLIANFQNPVKVFKNISLSLFSLCAQENPKKGDFFLAFRLKSGEMALSFSRMGDGCMIKALY